MGNNGKRDRFAIVADIHANTAALKVVWDHLDKEGISRIFCLGDVVGYNADPRKALEETREKAEIVIGGNHDRYVATGEIGEVRPSTTQVVEFTRKLLNENELEYLRKLEDRATVDDTYLLVHGSPRDRDEYILTSQAASDNLKVLGERFNGLDLCFFGHCHLPMIVGGNLVETQFHETRTVQLERFTRYLINPGSVGQPRDRCPKTSFGIFDPEAWTMTVVRLDYPIEETQKQIREAGLDAQLAKRLEVGM